MDGARLAEETAAEHVEDPFDLDEYPPERAGRGGIVRAMDGVGLEARGVRNFHRHGPDPCADIQSRQRLHDEAMEFGHRPGLEGDRGHAPVRALENEAMRNEVER